ncbi:nuclear transport factor 2 family protein [Pararhizobium haloflavum]|uniref:nuclear transport factor 2 family protein n=1 Tax=Pararhizobium haloflavum TaxID=2037914 RepID=UPI000C18D3D0|nr:nuclear transport factor 2 family protein [Pararhizobium haloflavum]
MDRPTSAVTPITIKQAIEASDGGALTGFYTDDAVLTIIDRNNPPSRPRRMHGREAIGSFWQDVCSRQMTHHVHSSVAEGDHLTFTEDCAYPDGTKVVSMAALDLKDGKIARQTIVQAWDE